MHTNMTNALEESGVDPLEKRLAELEARRKMLVAAMSKSKDAKESQLFRVLRNGCEEELDVGSMGTEDVGTTRHPKFDEENHSVDNPLRFEDKDTKHSSSTHNIQFRLEEMRMRSPSALKEIQFSNIAYQETDTMEACEKPSRSEEEMMDLITEQTSDDIVDAKSYLREEMNAMESRSSRPMSSLEELVTHATQAAKYYPELFAASADDFSPSAAISESTSMEIPNPLEKNDSLFAVSTNDDVSVANKMFVETVPNASSYGNEYPELFAPSAESLSPIEPLNPPGNAMSSSEENEIEVRTSGNLEASYPSKTFVETMRRDNKKTREIDFNVTLEERLNMMILDNPLWQKALEDYENNEVDGKREETSIPTSSLYDSMHLREVCFNGDDNESTPLQDTCVEHVGKVGLSSEGNKPKEEHHFKTDADTLTEVWTEEIEINMDEIENSFDVTTVQEETTSSQQSKNNFFVSPIQTEEPSESCVEKPIHLKSNQWSIRHNTDLETPRRTNTTNNGFSSEGIVSSRKSQTPRDESELPPQCDFGVRSDLSENSADLQNVGSSLPNCSREDRYTDDVGNCDENSNTESFCTKPSVPQEPTNTTDFTVQSIAYTSTLQTNIESLGDESLVRRKRPTEELRSKAREIAANLQGSICSTFETESVNGSYTAGLKKVLMNPTILCQCTGPIALTKVSSPSHNVFGATDLDTDVS